MLTLPALNSFKQLVGFVLHHWVLEPHLVHNYIEYYYCAYETIKRIRDCVDSYIENIIEPRL